MIGIPVFLRGSFIYSRTPAGLSLVGIPVFLRDEEPAPLSLQDPSTFDLHLPPLQIARLLRPAAGPQQQGKQRQVPFADHRGVIPDHFQQRLFRLFAQRFSFFIPLQPGSVRLGRWVESRGQGRTIDSLRAAVLVKTAQTCQQFTKIVPVFNPFSCSASI